MATTETSSSQKSMSAMRGFAVGRFMLELGEGARSNPVVGVIASVDGGHFKSEAIGEKVGAEGLETRYPGRQKFEDITISVGASMNATFWDWINASIGNNYKRKNGAIIAYDKDGYERSRRTFFDAIVAEVQFPALDATSKTPAMLTVKISPERIEYESNKGDRGPQVDMSKQRNWLCANFIFKIDGFTNMQLVNKVDQFSVKKNIILNPIGNELYVRKEVGRIDYPNFSFSYPEGDCSKQFVDWWQNLVSKQVHAGQEHTGSLQYLDNSANANSPLLTVSFEGLGITGVTFDKLEAGADKIRTLKIDLYCENLKIKT